MGYLKVVCAIFIWSSLGIFVRKSGLPIVGTIFYPAVVAGTCQLVLLSIWRKTRVSRAPVQKWKDAGLLLLLPFSFLANSLFFYYAFTHTSIANAVLSHYTAPIFVAFMAPLLLKEDMHRTTWLAILLSTAGLWIMLGGVTVGEKEWNGIGAGVASGMAYAVIIMVARGIAPKYSPLFIVLVQNVVVALALLPLAGQISLTMSSLPYVVIMGIAHSTVAPILYVQGVQSVRAHEAAILGYFEPIGAILLALIFLHEIPGLKTLAGGLLILYSGYIIIARKRMERLS